MLIKVVDDVAITQRKSGLLHFRNNSESCKNVKQYAEKISETHAVRDKADILVRRYCAVNISCFISCKCFLFDFLLVVLGCNPFTMVHLINFSFFRCLFSLYQVNECPNILFLPRRISQDLVENGFSNGRLDHRTTSAAITKVNMVKEIKASVRSSKKRNASGQLIANTVIDVDEHCTEYASNLISNAIKAQSMIIDENCPYIWRIENGIEVLSFNYC
jgi:hypothetical protein